MGYFAGQNLRRFVGKTIKKIESAHEGTVTITFTDKTTMTIDACVEHEKIERQINLIVNAVPAGVTTPPRDARPITVVRQPEIFVVPYLTHEKHLDRFRVIAGGIVIGEVRRTKAPVYGWQFCYRGTWYREPDNIGPTRGSTSELLFQTWAQDNVELARNMVRQPKAPPRRRATAAPRRSGRMVGLAGNAGL